jgi:hypothetical protein
MKSAIFATVLLSTSLLTACAYHHQEPENAYTPGLGEIMAQSASRHVKLWLAGQAQNWDLAAYEVDELYEGFEEIGKYHPTHKQIKQTLPKLIAQYLDQPLAGLEQAIKDKNQQDFVKYYDELTVGCNTCHQATEFGFNVVSRPTFNPFSNQLF